MTDAPTPRRRLHPDGPECSALVWGVMRLLEHPAARTPEHLLGLIQQVVDLGMTTVDHADIYGGYAVEAVFGNALALDPGLRHRLQLVTKCGIGLVDPARPQHRVKHYDSSAAHITASVERSLQHLHTDYLDLLLIHRPDPLMDAAATAQALDTLVESGKVRRVGVSNFTPAQVALLQAHLRVPLATHQLECSLVHNAPLDNGLLDDCRLRQMVPMIWSPLGGGRLLAEAAGFGAPHDPGQSRPSLPRLLHELALQYGLADNPGAVDADACAAIALAWLRTLPDVPVLIVGSMRIGRLARYAATQSLTLERQDWFRLLEAARGTEVP